MHKTTCGVLRAVLERGAFNKSATGTLLVIICPQLIWNYSDPGALVPKETPKSCQRKGMLRWYFFIPRWHPCVVQVCLTSKPTRTQHKYASSCLVCDLQNVMLSCAPSIDALLEPQFLVALNMLEFGSDSERHSNRCSIGMDLCAPQKTLTHACQVYNILGQCCLIRRLDCYCMLVNEMRCVCNACDFEKIWIRKRYKVSKHLFSGFIW